MDRFDIAIIGAGVVGLAIASELSSLGSVVVIEKNNKFGQETSSRNSEVIHAGLYYPPGSLKAKLCLEGNRLLYEMCEKYDIPYKNCGKFVVAVCDGEIPSIEKLKINAEKNGVAELTIMDEKEIKKIEPYVNAVCGLYSPSTGIIDSHRLMVHYLRKAEDNGVIVSYNTPLMGLDKNCSQWNCRISEPDGSGYVFSARTVINAAGLGSGDVAKMYGLDYKLYFCKGEYFSVANGKNRFLRKLVYPSPSHDMIGLGIHPVIDLAGGLKLGPNACYVDTIDYKVNPDNKDVFYESVVSFLPFIEKDDLSPDMSGIRPKLQGPGDPVKDFIIKPEEGDREGIITLTGIDSPGLTSSPAIAKYVAELYKS